jgi:carnitine O-acetyltransferase
MGQYKNVFGTSRVSGEKMDSIVHQYPTIHKHIIVMVKEQFFKVQVYGGGNSRVPLKELERLLFLVAKESLETSKEPNVGILTAGHRDNTFQGINLLKTLSEKNKENFKSIDDALLVLCLDDHSSKKNIDRSHLQVFHNQTGKNRYFDKALQIIVANNGRAGLNGEVL